MKNILFINENDISPQRGGIESITTTLVQELIKKNKYRFHLAYYKDIDESFIRPFFNTRTKLSRREGSKQLSDLILKNNINTIIIQQLPMAVEILQRVIDKERRHIDVIYVQHDYLSNSLIRSIKNYMLFLLKNGSGIERAKASVKLALFPLYSFYIQKYLRHKIGTACTYADKIVILSQRFRLPGQKYIRKENIHKVTAIGNCLTLNSCLPSSSILTKKKEVLIVSRLDENRKRLLVALKIWSIIESTNTFSDWHLSIVGCGRDENIYKKEAERLGLTQLSFEGTQQSITEYYSKASIFMMTSDMEGWGLTLTESLQMGVIPLVFDSFESVHDIIENNVNGFILPNNNINVYAKCLENLMKDDCLRILMAKKAIESSQKFSVDKIINQWSDLIEK